MHTRVLNVYLHLCIFRRGKLEVQGGLWYEIQPVKTDRRELSW